MRRAIPADTYVALVLLLAGAAVLDNLLGADLTGPYASPATLPMAATVVLIALSLVLLVGSLRRARPPEEAPIGKAALGRVLALFVATALFIAAMPYLGYVVAGIVFMLAAGLIFGNRNPFSLGLVAVVAPLALFFFFEKVMLVFLPPSRLFG